MPFDDKEKLRQQEQSATGLTLNNQNARSRQAMDVPAPTSTLPAGTIIAGQYRVISLLGTGGMSQVYRCQDMSLDRQVAVKLLLLHTGANAQAVLRFQREGKAIAMLNHENIVKVFALQVSDDHQPVMVMEVVDGISLADLVEGGKQLPLPRVLQFVSQICDALTHAHSQGVIHRDLKPSNIMLINPGQTNERIKILDFGIAKIVTGDSIKATQTGEVFGSPAYMSPEQAEGKHVDARTDQYSLGCVAFELLTGRPPFIGNSQISVIVAHLQEEPPTLSQFCKKTIPAGIEKTVMQLLEKSPEKRYHSISDVKTAFFPDPSKTISRNSLTLPRSRSAIALAVTLLPFSVAAAIIYLQNGEHAQPATAPKLPSALRDDSAKNFEAFANLSGADQKLGMLVHSGTQDIDMSKTPISDSGMQLLGCLHTLNSLVLDGCTKIGDQGIVPIGKVPMRTLSLEDTAITNNALKTIGQLSSLINLNLSKDSVSDAGLSYLKDLKGLQTLRLNATDITGHGLESLSGMNDLRELHIDNNPGLHGKLQSLRKLNSVRELSMVTCDLDNADLANVSQMKHLVSLTINRNVITDLQPLTKLPQLQTLYATECPGIDGHVVRRFLADHPRTQVRFSSNNQEVKLGPLK